MPDSWNIRARSDGCTQCQRAFEADEMCFTELAPDADGYLRRDLCERCRDTGPREPAAVSRWRSRFEPPAPPPPEPIERDSAEEFLRRFADSDEAGAVNTRFILALMLERKRILRCRDRFHDEAGVHMFVYEHARTGETFVVADPGLTPAQASAVREDVSLFLQTPPGRGEDAPAAEASPEDDAHAQH